MSVRWLAAAVLAFGLVAGCGGDDEEPAAPEAAEVHWSYSGEDGPTEWASLSPDYEECAAGRRQSPIDLGAEDGRVPPLEIDYRPSPVELENNGHTVQASYETGSGVSVAGKRYELAQFHFHVPSEHTVSSEQSPLELHFVHTRGDDEFLVLGVLVEPGSENAAWKKITEALPALEGETVELEGEVDARELLPDDAETAMRWSYDGSLTTPPCTEGVRWNIFREPLEMSSGQLERFASAYDGNRRPTQPVRGREVRLAAP